MEKLKIQILNCLNKKISCYHILRKELKKDEQQKISKILDKEQQQYNSVKKIFETSQFSVKEKGMPDIERIAQALSGINMDDSPILEILKCAMQSEKLHYRLFSLLAQYSNNSLTANIFENFAKEVASHSLILEEMIESKY
jgi:DNA-binding FadR family transcriptional regulator